MLPSIAYLKMARLITTGIKDRRRSVPILTQWERARGWTCCVRWPQPPMVNQWAHQFLHLHPLPGNSYPSLFSAKRKKNTLTLAREKELCKLKQFGSPQTFLPEGETSRKQTGSGTGVCNYFTTQVKDVLQYECHRSQELIGKISSQLSIL